MKCLLILHLFTIHIHCDLTVQYIYARPNQLAVFEGAVIPWCKNCTSNAIQQGLGVVGAVIMPHNLYLHSGLVLVRETESKFVCIQ